MDTWHIYRITDYNECPPVTTFYDSSRDRSDALEDLRSGDKDMSLVEVSRMQVRRLKSDMVDLLNAVSASPRFADLSEEQDEGDSPRTYGHLTVIK